VTKGGGGAVRDFLLGLYGCSAIRSEDDVANVGELFATLGLHPAEDSEGPPADDPRKFVKSRRQDHASGYGRTGPQKYDIAEDWLFPLVRLESPGVFTLGRVMRLGSGAFRLTITVENMTRAQAGMSLDDFAATYGLLLERIGAATFEAARPDLALVAAQRPFELPELTTAVDEQRLVVGWRTWFGTTYTDAYTPEWLLALPDEAKALPAGGVFHALHASPVQMLVGDPDPYAALWPFLEQADVTPAWPKGGQATDAARQRVRQ
jgi:hypothetical protein